MNNFDVPTAATMDPIILVCGFGRCGSSMVMQMLAAGGLPTSGEWPDYEGPHSAGLIAGFADINAWRRLGRHAVKVLDPHEHVPPSPLSYRAVWLSRDEDEQAKSSTKFAREMLGLEFGRQGRRQLAAGFRANRPAAMRTLRSLGGPILNLSFEDVLLEPDVAAMKLEMFIGLPLNRGHMAAAVRRRGPACLPGLLELDLLAAKHAAPKGQMARGQQ